MGGRDGGEQSGDPNWFEKLPGRGPELPREGLKPRE